MPESACKLAAEALGTMFLLVGIVGTGIAGMNFSGGNEAITLLAVSLSAGAMLYVWINVFASTSGAHFNPVVTLAFCLLGQLRWSQGAAYALSQCAGAIAGAAIANLMFGIGFPQRPLTVRYGLEQWGSEAIATFGLVLLILLLARRNPPVVAPAVACFIVAIHWCTGSSGFANPAVTVARSMTDTFAGIAPAGAPAFILAQLLGGVLAFVLASSLIKAELVRNDAS